jgi:hypothetical protein
MVKTETYLLENDSKQDRRRGRDFDVLRPTRLRNESEIIAAARKSGHRAQWIALHGKLAARALYAAANLSKRLGYLMVWDHVESETATALTAGFERVVFVYPRNFLPRREMAEVLRASNAANLFVGGSIDESSKTAVLCRGNWKPIVVPLNTFKPSGDGTRPDFDGFTVTDYGQTLKFGEYEASSDAVLYEHDPEYRRQVNAFRRESERGFGPSLRRLRTLKGLGREEFGPISAKTIARIERGESEKPQADTVRRIAKRLGVDPVEIETY